MTIAARKEFEQGPIRPPNEARSLLLRITRNCPWNRCMFCPVYKKRKFSLRTVNEIKKDIETAREIADELYAMSSELGVEDRVDDSVIGNVFSSPEDYSDSYRSVAAWLYYETNDCFLQDADNLVVPVDDLVEILEFLREKFPEIKRITTYARSRTVVGKSVEALKRLKNAGLNRIHIGLESGSDRVLKFIRKGVSSAQHLEAGVKVREAGIELSEYVMPGLGGREMWREHALETARVLNGINPDFIRLRSLRVPRRVPLYQEIEKGTFTMQTDDMVVEEIKIMIENLDGITSTVTSDHIMNLLEEVEGKLPDDREKMLRVIKRYQKLSETDRLIYRMGRRGGAYKSTSDLAADPVTYSKLSGLVRDINLKEGPEAVENFIRDMVDRYI
ncbi:MAG: radical SAM protein [Desulfatiglandaceae bacterium]